MPDGRDRNRAPELRADPPRVWTSRATGPAEADWRSDRGPGPPARQARSAGEGPDPAAAEAEASNDLRLRLRLDRRLRADLGLSVRRRLRRPALPARARPCDPAAPRGSEGLGADVHPLPGR